MQCRPGIGYQGTRSPLSIIKAPLICDIVDEVLSNDELHIEYAFIPLRDIHDAALSRIAVSDHRDRERYKNPSDAPGGLWGTDNPDEQEWILYQKLLKLLIGLSARNIPVVFIHYPKLAEDPIYLFDKLMPILKGIEYQKFENFFQNTVRAELVHSF